MMQTALSNPVNAVSIVVAFVGVIVGYKFALVFQEGIRSGIKVKDEQALSLMRMDELRNSVKIERALSMIRTDELRNRVESEQALSIIRMEESMKRVEDEQARRSQVCAQTSHGNMRAACKHPEREDGQDLAIEADECPGDGEELDPSSFEGLETLEHPTVESEGLLEGARLGRA